MLHRTDEDGFWDAVIDVVRDRVGSLLGKDDAGRAPVIAYLRDLESIARRECGSREVVPVIASGRRLLGDASAVEPADAPFARA